MKNFTSKKVSRLEEESVEQLRCAAQSCKEKEISILTLGNQGRWFKKIDTEAKKAIRKWGLCGMEGN